MAQKVTQPSTKYRFHRIPDLDAPHVSNTLQCSRAPYRRGCQEDLIGMSNAPAPRRPGSRLRSLFALLFLASAAAYGQQTYVTRFDIYGGYAYLNSPHVSLAENGFQLQAGFRPVTWLSLGVDYSRSSGDLTLNPSLLLTSLQQQINGEIALYKGLGALPAAYNLSIPAHSVTQTIAGGPQLAFRHWKPVTLFLRPDLGAMHERATPNPAPGDSFADGVVASLAPAGYKTDWVAFYGFGGGVDFNFSKHVGVRVQADFVHDHLFGDLLQDSRNTVRLSVGPCFNMGKNIAP